MAKHYGITVTTPKFGISRGDYYYDKDKRTISKGIASIKHLGKKVADELYGVSHNYQFDCFAGLLRVLNEQTSLDAQQLSILIHIDFFSNFGNQRELENIVYFWNFFKKGEAKQIRKDKIAGSLIEEIVSRYSTDRKKDGTESTSYTLIDTTAIILECEKKVMSLGLKDYGVLTKMRYFNEAMGYGCYVSGNTEDRPVLFVRDVFPVKRKKDGKQFGYNVLTQSIGSGVESRFTVFTRVYDQDPIRKGDVIRCLKWRRDGKGYFTMERYCHITSDDDPIAELENS